MKLIILSIALLGIGTSSASEIANPTLKLRDQTNMWNDQFKEYAIECSSDVSLLCDELTNGELPSESGVECRTFLENPANMIKILPSRGSKIEEQVKKFKSDSSRIEYQTLSDPWWEKAYIENGRVREYISSIICQ